MSFCWTSTGSFLGCRHPSRDFNHFGLHPFLLPNSIFSAFGFQSGPEISGEFRARGVWVPGEDARMPQQDARMPQPLGCCLAGSLLLLSLLLLLLPLVPLQDARMLGWVLGHTPRSRLEIPSSRLEITDCTPLITPTSFRFQIKDCKPQTPGYRLQCTDCESQITDNRSPFDRKQLQM